MQMVDAGDALYRIVTLSRESVKFDSSKSHRLDTARSAVESLTRGTFVLDGCLRSPVNFFRGVVVPSR